MNPISKMIAERGRGLHTGIYACCSANEYVITAAMRRAKRHGLPLLIEATANQVNQFGGYTGQTPGDFYAFCHKLAQREGFDSSGLILGGDHLGPLVWRGLPEEEAMANAQRLVSMFVYEGFTKIHIDTSMHLGSDPDGALPDTVIAVRGAQLCAAAEQAYEQRRKQHPDAVPPVYVIGSEVPIPGGAQEEEVISVTSPSACRASIKTFRDAFEQLGLAKAWERVVAVVVQPGVEFSESGLTEYDSKEAAGLCAVLRDYPGLVFEGHSTDYQTRRALREMVCDGIAILKVGPALTFALREGLCALEHIEKAMFASRPESMSGFAAQLEQAMIENPEHWRHHYSGSEENKKLSRLYGLSDRARYYLPLPRVQQSIDCLISNLRSVDIPPALISQFLPMQYMRMRAGTLISDPVELLLDRVGDCIDDYIYAVRKQ